MKNLFNAYYKFSYLRPSCLSITSQFGYCKAIEGFDLEADFIDMIEFKGIVLSKSNDGKIRLTNLFSGDLVGVSYLRSNPANLIAVCLNSNQQTIEIFVVDKQNPINEFLIHISTEEDLLTEMALVRLQAYCLS